MGNDSHSVWIFVCCCTYNLKPDLFLFCSSLIQDCFKQLSMSVPFFSFTLFFSPSGFLTVKKNYPWLLTRCIALSPMFFILRLFLNLYFRTYRCTSALLSLMSCDAMRFYFALFMPRCGVTELHFELQSLPAFVLGSLGVLLWVFIFFWNVYCIEKVA